MELKISTVLFVGIVCFTCGAWGDLRITGVKCGSKICKPQEYCSEFDRQCYPCTSICNQGHHNYDENLCMKDCQDYLHDIRYVRKDGGGAGGNEDLRATVQRLHSMVIVTLTLTCLVVIALIVIITMQFCRSRNNKITLSSLFDKFRSKKANSNSNKTLGNGVTAGQLSGKPDLRLEIPSPATQSDHSPVTVTTSISRRPAEDSTLDYVYDNHAMSGSPGPGSKPHESNF